MAAAHRAHGAHHTISQRPFHVMLKPIGALCNLACDYCYYLEKKDLYPPGERFRMEEGVLETFVKGYLRAQPGPTVVFPWHGGEPLLRGLDFFRKAVALQRRHLPRGWTCINVLQTNGVLLSPEWCGFLREAGFLVGLSIDGPAALHDAFRRDRRGRPSHARVMRGLQLLREHEVEHSALCVVNSANVDKPLEVYDFFKAEQIPVIQFLPLVEHDGQGRVSTRTPAPEAWGAFLIAVFDEWLNRYDPDRVWVQIIEECLRVWRGEEATLCHFRETCGDSLALEHNGDLFACDHYVVEAYKLGNICRDPFPKLLQSPLLSRFREAKRAELPAMCRACDVRFMCNGGCPKDRILRTPQGEVGLNYLCAGYLEFFHHIGPYLERVFRLKMPSRIAAATEASAPTARGESGRNDPCSCGSGRKYKLCCLKQRGQRTPASLERQ